MDAWVRVSPTLTKFRVIGQAPNSVVAPKIQPTQSPLGGGVAQNSLPSSCEVCHINYHTTLPRVHVALQQGLDPTATADGGDTANGRGSSSSFSLSVNVHTVYT